MAKKISQLTQATEVKSDDVTVIVQDGETKKLPLNMMVTKQDIENKKVAGLAKLDEIEATYENDTYTPTITVENKSSVKTGEGDEVDYSANVMDGHVKSAILKGNTLVNIISSFSFINNVNTHCYININQYKLNQTYTYIIFNIPDNISQIYLGDGQTKMAWLNWTSDFKKLGSTIMTTVTCPSSYDGTKILPHFRWTDESPSSISDMKFMLIEGDYTNINISYFEGMQSVKMPVLTTTGKNLFDGELQQGFWSTSSGLHVNHQGSVCSVNPIKVQEDTYLTISQYGEVTYNGTMMFLCYDANNNLLGHIYNRGQVHKNTSYVHFRIYDENGTMQVVNPNIKIQVESSSIPTSYEPFKSNILTIPSDLTLRGIGDVKDTLDCLTGEVTERIGEIVLDGSEQWSINAENNEGCFSAISTKYVGKLKGNIVSDRLPTTTTSKSEGVMLGVTSGKVMVSLNRETSGVTSISLFKQYLSQNPLTVQYELATESIKTVDLIPSGTHPSTTPYCWKDGHIQLSSSGLLPSLEYSVVTSRAGQISQNAAMIVKNDKRIFDLEILLAGGLVNTTYQALTLQNQVETGLSKVSLSSEKEPDYLLYHMIMKLIEEKAYKLDDLAEKVSVFYLYEKLSDEQFETIYSELYPFVEEEYIELPEDGEIIEEPIVDEVLEEVENGVVM